MTECMRMIEDDLNGESLIYLPRSGLVQRALNARKCALKARKRIMSFCDAWPSPKLCWTELREIDLGILLDSGGFH